MIYLFNSASRPLYQKNILNTLFLPEGWTNEYRYRYSGIKKRVSSSFIKELDSANIGKDIIIIYIDQNYQIQKGSKVRYRFHPIRLAKFMKSYKVNNRIHIIVQLKEFVYPKKIEEYQHSIYRELKSKQLPQSITNVSSVGGLYAIMDNSELNKKDFLFNDKAWIRAVNDISKSKSMRSTLKEQIIFQRLEIYKDTKKMQHVEPIKLLTKKFCYCFLKSEEFKIKHISPKYNFSKLKSYQIRFIYRNPLHNHQPTIVSQMKIRTDDTLRLLGNNIVEYSSNANTSLFPFTFCKQPDDTVGSINFDYIVKDNHVDKIIGSDYHISYTVSDSNWYIIGGLIILFLICSGVNIISFSEPITSFIQYLKLYWFKGISILFQGFSLVLLIKLIGKKLF